MARTPSTFSLAARMTAFQLRFLLGTPFFVLTALATPASFCLLKLVGSAGTAADGSLWTLVLMSGTWGTTTTAAGIIGFQRFQGTLSYLALSPLPSGAVFYPVVLSAVAIGAVVGVPESLALCALLGAAPSLAAPQVMGCALVVLSCAALAPLVAVPFLYTRDASAYEPIVLVAVWVLSGGVVPVSELPSALGALALASPLTSAVSVCVAEGGVPWESVALCLALCAALGVAGYRLLSHAIERSRVTGTLGLA